MLEESETQETKGFFVTFLLGGGGIPGYAYELGSLF